MADKNYVELLNVKVNVATKKSVLKDLIDASMKSEKKFIVTANPEILMNAYEDSKYGSAIKKADYIVADGIGVVLASKMNRTSLPERIPGYDLMIELLNSINFHGQSCYFLGASESVNSRLIKVIKNKYPDIKIAGHSDGYFSINDEKVLKSVLVSKPDFIFVALGMPKQEEWIARHFELFDKGIFMGVGGSFDVLAGEVNRAPKLWIRLNLEWLYRIIQDPVRLKRLPQVLKFLFYSIVKRK
ncbi:N-acetylglucosaminyldiphosphoundecaprenol N-acetyl-beta-D-mannosaminyltransferase [Streptohalobacillus salinus]|uniref:N-acetylglucosaminyldiphosphoundecaprenol N-acetyl-beta-D-mannosaminyltransferase n=1 Tax=Streptohalobacillus salinus TaxID=621096 RepID=A0A2V3WD97_9BACI|nr:WecB/TagA/CpsF family glycosyltransferase [Streptohalobacillus salinus]PXW92024.1 N-acetylglucosaminyldiphosphoundecaprenol N-acetyl-beta-D-mannosaminyltransferase [Streptohalobacillus salinus]